MKSSRVPIVGKAAIVSLMLVLTARRALGASDEASQSLFIIERSTNANVIHYDAKLGKDGKLDAKEPVVAYWVMKAEDGRRQGLSALEKKMAYGFAIENGASDHTYRMILVSQKQRQIQILEAGGKIVAETQLGGRLAYLRKIYVKTRKSGFLRTADYFELFGIDVVTGAECYEKVLARR